jgi:WD40 repeat protein
MAVLEHRSRIVIVTGDKLGSVRVSDLTTGHCMHELHGHQETVVAIATAIQANGTPTAVTSDAAGRIRVWDLDTGSAIGSPLHVPQTGALAAHRMGIVLGYQSDLAHLRWSPRPDTT